MGSEPLRAAGGKPQNGESDERGVDQFTEMMNQEEMPFLAGRATFAWYNEVTGGDSLGFTSSATEKCHTLKVEVLRFVQCSHDIGRIATGGQRNYEIAGVSQARNLPRKHLFVTVVVANAGDE